MHNIMDVYFETNVSEKKNGRNRLFRKKTKAEKESILSDYENQFYNSPNNRKAKSNSNRIFNIFGSKQHELPDKGR